MYVRQPTLGSDIDFCCEMAMSNWGLAAADRCHLQMIESMKKGPYSPVFGIADIGDPLSRDFTPMPVGFAAYAPSMLMKGAFDLIWLAVHPTYQKLGVGKHLINWRLDEIGKRDGQLVTLCTQKPDYFSRFGFFKLHHVGNDWYLMLKLLKRVDI